MNNSVLRYAHMLVISSAIILTTACSTSTIKPDGAEEVRQKLTQLQTDSLLSSRAQVAIKEAEAATRIAEKPEKDIALAKHRVFMADAKVEIALAIAQTRLLEDQREGLRDDQKKARLDSRTAEVDQARKRTDLAQEETERANERNEELEKQLVDLNAKKSERGMVLTLGDILFETGKSALKADVSNDLDKLSDFLNKYQERDLRIEGYTDDVGSDEFNLLLSQQRAEAVRSYLIQRGVSANRMTTSGQGEMAPVASNESAMGRQKNRRVEIIILDNLI